MALQAFPFSAKRPLCGPEKEVMSPVLRKLPQLGLRSATDVPLSEEHPESKKQPQCHTFVGAHGL